MFPEGIFNVGSEQVVTTAQRLSLLEREALGVSVRNERYVACVLTKEFRPPQRGEWYVSGAIPQAYRALFDLTISYRICQLALLEPTTTYSIVKRANNDVSSPCDSGSLGSSGGAAAGVEPCWQCHGDGTIEYVICGWCEEDMPHSSCDDTWHRTLKCDACNGGQK